MNIFFDESQLTRMLEDFYGLSGIRAGVVGQDGREIWAGGSVSACAQAGSRCADCAERPTEGVRFFYCRVGARMAVLPIRFGDHSAPLAWLYAGPFLDSADPEVSHLRRLSREERAACAGMLEVLADSVRHRGLIQTAGETDLQRLERFLDAHYMDKLTLASVPAQLHIGRTRLCALAKQLSGGQTLFHMIAQRRIARAKELLIQSDRPISAVAEAVGISDYNYFSKVFRNAVGATPSEFRKRAHGGRNAKD